MGKSFGGGWVVVGGVVGTLPTATRDGIGKDQFALGPEALVANVGSWGALGLLVTQQWDVSGGEEGVDTNLTAGQYFYTFNLGNGWRIGSSPLWAYDRTAVSGQRWSVPIGTGVRKTTIMGSTPVRMVGEVWYYVVKPDAFGPEWRIRFVVTPVLPLPWG